MLPDWDLDETFDRLAAYGIEAVELRVRDNPPGDPAPSFWGRHVADVSPANVLDKVPAIRSAAARTGVRVCTLAPRLWPDKPEVVDAVLVGAHAIDPAAPPMVRLSPPGYDRSEPLPRAVRGGTPRHRGAAAAHAGTRHQAAVRDPRRHRGNERRARIRPARRPRSRCGRARSSTCPTCRGWRWKTPRQSLDLLGPYLAYCHIGGSRPIAGAPGEHGQRQWSWEFCALEEGVANIPRVVADLRAAGYDGYLTIEDFSARDTDLKLREGTAYLRRLLALTL